MATQPTLAMIPSGYKDGKLYSVLPTDGVGDFDVTRGSNATRINKDGLIETVTGNTPRLNYPLIDGVVSGCPSLLLEPSRTNLVRYSEAFDNAYWNKSGSSVTSGFISPTGALGAFKLVEDTSTGGHSFRHPTLSPSGYDTFSLYAKASERYLLQIYNGGDGTDSATFDLKEGTAVNNGVGVTSIIESIGNGWYRCLVTTNNKTGVIIFMQNAGSRLYEGDGTSGVYIFGAQLEQASYPTSYIPTQGGVETRFADTANNAGDAATFNDSEGVLFAETSTLADLDDTGYIALNAGTNFVNSLLIQYINSGELRLYNGGTSTAQMIYRDTSLDLSENIKIAIKYGTTSSSYKVYINGFSKTIESAFVATAMSGLDNLKFTYTNNSSNPFYGSAKQIQYFDTALTDSELEKLTSWTYFRDMAQGQLYSIK